MAGAGVGAANTVPAGKSIGSWQVVNSEVLQYGRRGGGIEAQLCRCPLLCTACGGTAQVWLVCLAGSAAHSHKRLLPRGRCVDGSEALGAQLQA